MRTCARPWPKERIQAVKKLPTSGANAGLYGEIWLPMALRNARFNWFDITKTGDVPSGNSVSKASDFQDHFLATDHWICVESIATQLFPIQLLTSSDDRKMHSKKKRLAFRRGVVFLRLDGETLYAASRTNYDVQAVEAICRRVESVIRDAAADPGKYITLERARAIEERWKALSRAQRKALSLRDIYLLP